MQPRHYAITCLALATLCACTPRTRRTPDDTIVLAIETEMTTWDPRYALTSYDEKLSKLCVPGLTALDTPSLEVRLELAQQVDRVDDRTYDVTLRPDARFSDGSAVTASDVAQTYMTTIAPDSNSFARKQLGEKFALVEAVAPNVARFHLKEPLATFMTDIDFGIVSFAHGPPAPGHAIGAGMYVVRELTAQHALLDANAHYFGEHPKLAHVEVKFVRDVAARLLMLVGGSADLLQNAFRLDVVDIVRERPRVRVESAPSVILTYLMMNNADPALADKRVRQAIALALDRPAVIAAKFGGRAVLATGLLAPSHWAYNGDVPRYTRDVARAKQLLDEAGFQDPDGDGPLPRLHLVYKTSADGFRVAIARVLAAQLGDIGIAVEVRSFEFATFFADIKKGNYQLGSMQTANITDPDFYYTYFHSSWIPTPATPDGYNRWRYKNADVDRLVAAGRHELDRAKRKAIYDEVQRIVAEDVPIVPLWHEDNVVLSNVDLRGFVMTPNARLTGLRDATKR